MRSGVRMRFRRYKLTRLKHYHWPKDLSFSYVVNFISIYPLTLSCSSMFGIGFNNNGMN